MSVEIPKIAVAFGSVTPPQGDVIELGIHLGCTKEVSSFECLLQNFDKKYTVTNPINVGDNCHFDVGRGENVPLILTGRVEEVEPESTPVENYIRVRGRCWGEKIFRRVVTKTYENKKGEEIVRDLIDYYVGLSHTRTESDLTSDAASGQKDVVVADASIFSVGDLVKIEDDNAWEYNEVSAVDTVTDTLTMVNNLADTYTVTANGKVWIDLIEKTDTTYTLLEYKDAKVFDILKYIAESADKSGVIGFDFRVEYDGKFAFFPKNSKTCPISLSEKIEHSRYSKDIHRVRNKIKVFGAAEKPYPLDVDGQPWSDSLTEDLTKPDNYLQHADGKWEPLIPTHETVSIETTTVHTGSRSVKIQSSSYDYYMGIKFAFNSDKYVNSNRYPKLCFTLREDNNHNKRVTVALVDKDGNDCWQGVDIADYDEWQSYTLGVGKQNQEAWTLGYDAFDWENIKAVRFDFHQKTSQYGVAYVDRMHFGGCRWSAAEEDSSSQSSYGLRELVEVDEELHSNNECSLRGKALLNHLSQPAEFLTIRTTCLDYGTDRLLPGDKIHVTLPNENIDSDFRIISVEYRVSARDQTLEIALELGKEKPLLADYLYGLRSTTVTVEKLMRTKAGPTGLVGSGGGGGGGGGGDGGADEKVKVSSDDTTTDFLLQKLLAGTGITLSENNPTGNEKVKIDAHRKWGWADEQGWRNLFLLPYGKWTRYFNNPVFEKSGVSGKFDELSVFHPCILRVGNYYYLFYDGTSPTRSYGGIGVARSTSPFGPFTRLNNGNPVLPSDATYAYSLGAVVYDEYETDANKRWKCIFSKFVRSSGADYKKMYSYSANPDSGWSTPVDSNLPVRSTNWRWGVGWCKFGNLYYAVLQEEDSDLELFLSHSPTGPWNSKGTILSRGGAGTWDDYRLLYFSVTYILGTFFLFYTGDRQTAPRYRVGMAISPDAGMTSSAWGYKKVDTWNTHVGLILDVGASGESDDGGVQFPSFIQVDEKMYLYYTGIDTDVSICVATIP